MYSTTAFMKNIVKFFRLSLSQLVCLENGSELVSLWINSGIHWQGIGFGLDSRPPLNLWQICRQLQMSSGFNAGYTIKGWHASFQDLANLKKSPQTSNGMSLHQFHLRRSPLAKSPSSSSLYQASGCTAGRQSDFMPGFLAFRSQKSSGFITSSQFYQQKI